MQTISKPGVIKQYLAHSSLVFGEISEGNSPRIKKLQELLAVDGIEVEAVSNIAEKMLEKFASICGAGIFTVMRGDKEKIFGFESTCLLIR